MLWMIVTYCENWPLTEKRRSPQIFDESRCPTREFDLLCLQWIHLLVECQVTMTSFTNRKQPFRIHISTSTVGLASVPLGTAPGYASEVWCSFTFWISKSQGNGRYWYCTFRYIWLCFLRCATGMRWDLPHWCEIIKIGVPVGWCEVCPLMWESTRARIDFDYGAQTWNTNSHSLHQATPTLPHSRWMHKFDEPWELLLYICDLRIIDADESGEISMDEFVAGCMQLEGGVAEFAIDILTSNDAVCSQCVCSIMIFIQSAALFHIICWSEDLRKACILQGAGLQAAHCKQPGALIIIDDYLMIIDDHESLICCCSFAVLYWVRHIGFASANCIHAVSLYLENLFSWRVECEKSVKLGTYKVANEQDAAWKQSFAAWTWVPWLQREPARVWHSDLQSMLPI